ncbi:helix-turn-helix domain-containing protein [Enterococcus sp. LJL90]
MTEQKLGYGDRIKRIRLSQPEANTLEKFGELLIPVASKGAVKNWENEDNLPNKQRLSQIAEIGQVTTDYILYGPMNIQQKEYNYLDALEQKVEENELSTREIAQLKQLYEEHLLLLLHLVNDREEISSTSKLVLTLNDLLNDNPILLRHTVDENGHDAVSNQLARERIEQKGELLHGLLEELVQDKLTKYSDD